MTNADKIRAMSDRELNGLLWWWGVNVTASFLEFGGEKVMNAKEIGEWLKSDKWECIETMRPEDATL